jgi:hypothetical protein
MFDLYSELRQLISALDQGRVDYALCGGMAVAVHGHPRATVDIDLLIPSESLNNVIAIAKTLDYTTRGLEMPFSNEAIEIRRVSKIDSETGNVLSLDLLLVTPQIQEVWNSRVAADWEGGTLSVVSRAGLIGLKKMRGSAQDEADINALLEDADDAN